MTNYNFHKDGFTIIKSAVSKEIADFALRCLLLRRKVTDHMFKTNYLKKDSIDFGTWNDAQVPGTFSIYASIENEVFLIELKNIMEKITNKKLYPTYSYSRVYEKGDELKKHIDRFSCEISTTLYLGGDPWPIYIKNENTDVEVNLEEGDMLVYKGNILEHWRNKFQGELCGQVFLHYNSVDTENAEYNKFDTRPFIGLPVSFKNGK